MKRALIVASIAAAFGSATAVRVDYLLADTNRAVRKQEYDPVALRKAQMMEALMTARGVTGGEFALTDHTGARRALDEFRGRLVLLYFGYTFCPDVCPSDLLQLSALLKHLGDRSGRVQVLFVTVDPERDTVEHLALYLSHFDERIVGLTGSVAEIREIADRYKTYFEKVPLKSMPGYVMDHSANLYLLDRDGGYLGYFPPGTSSERIADVLSDYL